MTYAHYNRRTDALTEVAMSINSMSISVALITKAIRKTMTA